VRAGHQRIYHGTVVVTGGSHTLGDAYSCKRLRHRSAIQRVLQDSVPGCCHFDRHVGAYHFHLADLVWGSLSEDCVVSSGRHHETECPLLALSGHPPCTAHVRFRG
jgi:hypothetical protein